MVDKVKKIKAKDEKDFLRQLKDKQKDYLMKLSLLERERIASHIKDLLDEVKGKHKELCDKIDDYDQVYRMQRAEVQGTEGDVPNYRSPLSSVTLEVIHANIMNVFFTPKDILRAIPVEANDMPKVEKLGVFGNWSVKNEMNIFERADHLFHNSEKTGECPYIVHWVKEYGTEIKRESIPDPNNPEKNLIDPDTNQPLYEEKEEQKLLYNGPKLEVFSRKDYFQPKNALMDQIPEWEGRKIRLTYDQYLREELQGKMYKGSIKELKGWGGSEIADVEKIDYEGDTIPTGDWEKEFVEWYGRMRISIVKRDAEDKIIDEQELEDEFIAIINLEDEVLCSLRKNKFPLKMRPIGIDYFMPDDEGRRVGIGVIEFMDGPQKSYDALFNQFIFGTTQSNSPFGFFSPTGNQRDEPLKVKTGHLYPTADPSSVNMVKLPPPDDSLQVMLEMVRNWAQLLFGISEYSMGVESTIDPSAPAKKAQLVVAQGSVRLNMIIKRKNKTLQDIFKRWYLLYKENLPPNKYMRIAGSDKDNPWKFESIKLEDFALKSIPDFELTGNILNANKQLEINKAIAIYQLLQTNFMFSPKTQQGMQAYHALTKWLIDKLDETGLSRFLPAVGGESVYTPEEENARFLQGDEGEPTQGEDHVNHLRVHRDMLADPTIPDMVRKNVIKHINATIKQIQLELTQRMVMADVSPGGGLNAPERPTGPAAPRRAPIPGMGDYQGGSPAMSPELGNIT